MIKFFTAFSAVTALLCCGCSESGIAEDTAPITSQIKASLNESDSLAFGSMFEADKAFLTECGYDTSEMVEYDDHYTVGTELVFHKSYIEESRKSPQPRLNFNRTVAVEYQHMHLNGQCFEFSDKDYIVDAAKAWNEIGSCNLNFSTSYDNNPDKDGRFSVGILISQYSIYTDLLKVVDAPLTGQPGTYLYINPGHSLWAQLSSDQKKYLVMHGLGHIVGLAHDNDVFNPQSIMQPESKLNDNKNLWIGFTSNDRADICRKYPLVSDPKITYTCQPKAGGMDGDWMSVGTTYKVTTNYTNPVIPNPVYSYVISKLDSNVQYEFLKNADNSFNLKFTAYGACKVTTNISQNGVVKNSYEQVYYGIADQFEYPSTVALGAFFDFKWTYWTPDSHDINTQFSVKEKFFDNNTARSVTMERVNDNQVRIRFNDYGSYEVAVECRSGSTVLSRRTFYFTKLFRPSCSLRIDSSESGSYELPSYATEPTGFHPLVTYKCSAHFATLRERVVCDVNMKYEQHTMLFRRVDRRTLDGAPVRVVLNRGASSHHALPDLYDMYDPSFANYEFNSKFVYQYYTDVTYPEEDGAGVR